MDGVGPIIARVISLIAGRSHAPWYFAAQSFAVLLVLHCSVFAATAPHGVDLDGHPVMLDKSTAPAIVLFFTAPDCPIAFTIRGPGKGSATFWTCDFTKEYIDINASYRT